MRQQRDLTATASGGTPFTYQWYDIHTNLIVGATNAPTPCGSDPGQRGQLHGGRPKQLRQRDE